MELSYIIVSFITHYPVYTIHNRQIAKVIRLLSKLLLFIISILLSSQFKVWGQNMATKSTNRSFYLPKRPTIIWSSLDENNKNKSLINKPIIDSSVVKHWQIFQDDNLAISNDGKYVMFNVMNMPYGNNTLTIQSIDKAWKKELIGVKNCFFSNDSKKIIFLSNDTLFLFNINNGELINIPQIDGFQFSKLSRGEWVFYKMKSALHELIIHNVLTGERRSFKDVEDYKFDPQGTMVLIKKIDHQNDQTTIQWIDLKSSTITNIWTIAKGLQLKNYSIDALRKQIVFLVSENLNGLSIPIFSLWYYKYGLDEPLRLIYKKSGVDTSYKLGASSAPIFTKDGKYLSFQLIKSELQKAKKEATQVDVWNYKDTIIQSVQLLNIAKGESQDVLNVVVDIKTINDSGFVNVVPLFGNTNEPAISYPRDHCGDFFLVKEHKGGDRFWESEFLYWLVSMQTGSRKLIFKSKDYGVFFWLSPDGRYLLHFNRNQYYCLDLYSEIEEKISTDITGHLNIQNPYRKGFNDVIPVGVAGWVVDDGKVLVYDDYDIWQLDLRGKGKPINITGGYGRKNKVKIRLINDKGLFKMHDTLLLSLFNPVNKYNGVCQIILNNLENKIDQPLTGPWSIYYDHSASYATNLAFNIFMKPLKAKDVNKWIVKRESVSEAPNYYLTNDFKDYIPLTTLQPQASYNWLTSELIHWQQPDGSGSQGVLYKPENFDSHKRYPVIIYYYHQFSGRLHQFPTVNFMGSTHIDVAWFVSRGYLVFTPDIYYSKKNIVESVCNSIISAGKCLALLPYVDGKHMAISSFSWGGVQTNWLLSQTNLFAAVATGGGAMGGDPVSTAFQIRESRGIKSDYLNEYVEDLLGGSLWDHSDRWLSVSPVLRANKIKSPVLILNSYGELAWQQNVELFMALRRLNKKVWLLQYDKGYHGVFGKDAEDFTVRITQFFDCFLKGALSPKWMSKGIPAKLKGIEDGYELDN